VFDMCPFLPYSPCEYRQQPSSQGFPNQLKKLLLFMTNDDGGQAP
jgi:hypothetical protein